MLYMVLVYEWWLGVYKDSSVFRILQLRFAVVNHLAQLGVAFGSTRKTYNSDLNYAVLTKKGV